jgi:hypothetical protein
LNQIRNNKKKQKLLDLRPVFAKCNWNPFDLNAYNFKMENRRRFSKTALDLALKTLSKTL